MTEREIVKEDMKWLVGLGVILIGSIWAICTRDFSKDMLANHIKFFYSVCLFVAVSSIAYLIIFKLKSKKEINKNGN